MLGINSDEKGERMVPEADGDDNFGFGIDHKAGGMALRKDIMEGAIVKSVMINAVQGVAVPVCEGGLFFEWPLCCFLSSPKA